MSETKFTPGPWKWMYFRDRDGSIDATAPSHLIGGDGLCVARHKADWRVKEANAHLIVAAPELYTEHKEWTHLLGAIATQAHARDIDMILELVGRLELTSSNGLPIVRSKALAKARGEGTE